MRHKKEDKQSSTHIVLYLPKPTIAILFGSREEVQISLKLVVSTKYHFLSELLTITKLTGWVTENISRLIDPHYILEKLQTITKLKNESLPVFSFAKSSICVFDFVTIQQEHAQWLRKTFHWSRSNVWLWKTGLFWSTSTRGRHKLRKISVQLLSFQ